MEKRESEEESKVFQGYASSGEKGRETGGKNDLMRPETLNSDEALVSCLNNKLSIGIHANRMQTHSLVALAGSHLHIEDQENQLSPDLKFPPTAEQPLASGQETPKLVRTSHLPSATDSELLHTHDPDDGEELKRMVRSIARSRTDVDQYSSPVNKSKCCEPWDPDQIMKQRRADRANNQLAECTTDGSTNRDYSESSPVSDQVAVTIVSSAEIAQAGIPSRTFQVDRPEFTQEDLNGASAFLEPQSSENRVPPKILHSKGITEDHHREEAGQTGPNSDYSSEDDSTMKVDRPEFTQEDLNGASAFLEPQSPENRVPPKILHSKGITEDHHREEAGQTGPNSDYSSEDDSTMKPNKSLRTVASTERFSCARPRSHVHFKHPDTVIEVDGDDLCWSCNSEDLDFDQKTRWPSPRTCSNDDDDDEDDQSSGAADDSSRVLVLEKDKNSSELNFRYCKKSKTSLKETSAGDGAAFHVDINLVCEKDLKPEKSEDSEEWHQEDVSELLTEAAALADTMTINLDGSLHPDNQQDPFLRNSLLNFGSNRASSGMDSHVLGNFPAGDDDFHPTRTLLNRPERLATVGLTSCELKMKPQQLFNHGYHYPQNPGQCGRQLLLARRLQQQRNLQQDYRHLHRRERCVSGNSYWESPESSSSSSSCAAVADFTQKSSGEAASSSSDTGAILSPDDMTTTEKTMRAALSRFSLKKSLAEEDSTLQMMSTAKFMEWSSCKVDNKTNDMPCSGTSTSQDSIVHNFSLSQHDTHNNNKSLHSAKAKNTENISALHLEDSKDSLLGPAAGLLQLMPERTDSRTVLIEPEDDSEEKESDHLPLWAIVILVIFFPFGILVLIYRKLTSKKPPRDSKVSPRVSQANITPLPNTAHMQPISEQVSQRQRRIEISRSLQSFRRKLKPVKDLKEEECFYDDNYSGDGAKLLAPTGRSRKLASFSASNTGDSGCVQMTLRAFTMTTIPLLHPQHQLLLSFQACFNDQLCWEEGKKEKIMASARGGASGASVTWRAWTVIFGGFLVHLTLGTIYTLGNITSYLTSYIRLRVDPTFTYEAATWIYTCNMMARGWFPGRKGLVTGIIVGGFGLDEEILDKVPILFQLLGGIYAVLQLIGCFLLRNPGENLKVEKPEVMEELEGLNNEAVDESPKPEEPSKPRVNIGPRDILKTKEFYMLWFTFFFNQQAIGYITTSYKTFGQGFIDDDWFLSIIGSIGSVFNSVGRMFWGWTADKTCYKTTMLLVTALLAIFFATLPLAEYGGKITYVLWVIGIFSSMSGTFALLPLATCQTFGQKFTGPNYGLVFTSAILGPPLQSLTAQLLTDIIGTTKLLLLTAGFAVISFLITWCFSKTPNPEEILNGKTSDNVENASAARGSSAPSESPPSTPQSSQPTWHSSPQSRSTATSNDSPSSATPHSTPSIPSPTPPAPQTVSSCHQSDSTLFSSSRKTCHTPPHWNSAAGPKASTLWDSSRKARKRRRG
ncbi:unnamed protein product [Notodromas monacha]|uniref:Uncharacterized protein n=1 Tax=Notodromas monacha TaxID=399045 RepID=A0A7R9BT27_9CRUS|nr:unnamed protein product [Notodromas monacha]CAG0921233.1 unnamed protein product [Notodromas monacha]